MDDMLFFDLIRVAIGRQERMSCAPSRDDWEALFAMAEKQALLGVCFAGVGRLQKMGADVPMDLYMKWLAVAANIQQRNELLNRGCVKVQQLLAEGEYRNDVLERNERLFEEQIELFMLFFGNEQLTDEQRWDFVEAYFTGTPVETLRQQYGADLPPVSIDSLL